MKFNVKYSEINYGFAIIEADSKEEAEDKAMEVYNAGNVKWVDSEVADIRADVEHDPVIDVAPITNPDYWDCYCDDNFIQSKSVEKCEKCGAWNGEMPDSRQAEIEQGIYFVGGVSV